MITLAAVLGHRPASALFKAPSRKSPDFLGEGCELRRNFKEV